MSSNPGAIETRYARASGLALEESSFIGLRYDGSFTRYRPGKSEAWVLTMHAGVAGPSMQCDVSYPTTRWLTGLYRSEKGKLFLVDGGGWVHIHPNASAVPNSPDWEVHDLGVPLDGVFGLRDDCVLAWGGTREKTFPLFRWNGRSFQSMPDPGFDIRDIHGSEEDNLCAVGRLGAISHFDGSRWRRIASPVRQTLVSVFVAGPEEFYATGAHGALLEGSRHGWGKIAQGPAIEELPLYSVAKWDGTVYVAAGAWGLLKRVPRSHELVTVTKDFRPTWIDARDEMVCTCDDVIAGTFDGKTFTLAARDALLIARERCDLLDFS